MPTLTVNQLSDVIDAIQSGISFLNTTCRSRLGELDAYDFVSGTIPIGKVRPSDEDLGLLDNIKLPELEAAIRILESAQDDSSDETGGSGGDGSCEDIAGAIISLAGKIDISAQINAIVPVIVTSIEAELTALEGNLKVHIDNKHTAIVNTLTSIQNTITSVSTKIDTLTTTVNTVNTNITSLTSTVNTINTTVNTINTRSANQTNLINNLQTSVNTLTTTLNSVQTTINNISSSVVGSDASILNQISARVNNSNSTQNTTLTTTINDAITTINNFTSNAVSSGGSTDLTNLTNLVNTVLVNLEPISIGVPVISGNLNSLATFIANLNIDTQFTAVFNAIANVDANIDLSPVLNATANLQLSIDANLTLSNEINNTLEVNFPELNGTIPMGECIDGSYQPIQAMGFSGKGFTGLLSGIQGIGQAIQTVNQQLCLVNEQEPNCFVLAPDEPFAEFPISKQLILYWREDNDKTLKESSHWHTKVPMPREDLDWCRDFANLRWLKGNIPCWSFPVRDSEGVKKKRRVGGYFESKEAALDLIPQLTILSELSFAPPRCTYDGEPILMPQTRTLRLYKVVLADIVDNKPVAKLCLTPPKGGC